MTRDELRRAYLRALNEADPALNPNSTPEKLELVRQAGQVIFGPEPEQPAGEPALSGDITLINERRQRKIYDLIVGLAADAFSWLGSPEVKSPVSPAELRRRSKEFVSELRNRAGRSFSFARLGATIGELAKAKGYTPFSDMSESERILILEEAFDAILPSIEILPSRGELISLAASLPTVGTLRRVYDRAIELAGDGMTVLDLFADGLLALRAKGASDPTLKGFARRARLRIQETSQHVVLVSDFLEMVLRFKVQIDDPTLTNRDDVLKAFLPVVEEGFTASTIAVLRDIRVSEWLPFSVTASVDLFLRRLLRSGAAEAAGLRAEVEDALSERHAPLPRSGNECDGLLVRLKLPAKGILERFFWLFRKK